MRVLIVEDEGRIARLLEDTLREEGFSPLVARDGEQGVQLGLDPDVGLVILDVMLPKLDGYGVLAALRSRRPDLPVLMLTARDDLPSKVSGLDAGADDYLTKPFALAELLARLRGLLRRRGRPVALRAGGIILDLQTRAVRVGDVTVELTSREFALLEYLMRHPGQVVTRRQILAQVWGLDFDPLSTVVETGMNRLRRKLARAGSPSSIETVRGAGYQFRVE